MTAEKTVKMRRRPVELPARIQAWRGEREVAVRRICVPVGDSILLGPRASRDSRSSALAGISCRSVT
jgi:hypothetical protein